MKHLISKYGSDDIIKNRGVIVRKTTKFFKKTISIMIAFMIVISSLCIISSSTAFAAESESYITYDKEIYDENKAVCDTIAEGISNLEDEIYIGDFGILKGNLQYIIKTVIRMHPEFFYLDSRYMYTTDGTYAIDVCPVYLFDEQTTKQKQEVFNTEVQKYVSKVDESMSDFKKAVIIHDELALKCSYFTDSETNYATAYSAIVNNKANCQGYSEAYSYLLSLVGVKSELVESTAMNHAWNKVCIDGEYYHVDLTWDDPVPNKDGHVEHTYFLLSDDAISSGSDHYGFDSSFKSESTKYDNYKYRYVDTKFCYVGDDCYFIDNTASSEYEKCLLNYDYTTDTVEVVKRFDYRWSAGGSSYWVGGFMSLDEYDDILYYNTPDGIYTYNTENGEISDFSQGITFSKDCYGLVIIDEKVYAVLCDNPNVVGTLQYVGDCIKVNNILLGDVDGDGMVTIKDATYIQKYSADIVTLTDDQMKSADFDQNGVVNVLDATGIQRSLSR